MKTIPEYTRIAMEYMESCGDFPDDYEDVNDILTGLAILAALSNGSANATKAAIEAAFYYGWQRRGMTEVDREIWG